MKNLTLTKGYVVLLFSLLFSAITVVMVIGASNPIIDHFQAIKAFSNTTQAYMGANASIDEAIYRLKKGWNLGSTETLGLKSATTSITNSSTQGKITIIASASTSEFQRNVKVDLVLGTGISFYYGIQSGRGGFELRNSSSVTGNVFSEGTVKGSGNMIYGDVISSGPSGHIDGIHATGTAYAHTIEDSTIDKNAYYTTLTNSTVGGTKFPNSADQPAAPLPITDAQIAEWEAIAAAGTPTPCSGGAVNTNASTTLGPTKIACDWNINGTSGGFTVTIKGPVWVEGNINLSQKATIAMSPELGSENAAIIADKPSASTTSGIITLSNNATFQGTGSSGSYVFMISQNSSAENGGSTNAITVGQSSSALIGYAIHGLITLSQSVSLKEATAYKILLTNSANVRYDSGLPNTLFSSGPSGGYEILDWYEF